MSNVLTVKFCASLLYLLQSWLKPGGQLLVADYCTEGSVLSSELEALLKEKQLQLVDHSKYKQVRHIP